MTTRIIALASMLALTACDQSKNTQKITALDEKVASLERRLTTQDGQYTSLLRILAESEKGVNERITFIAKATFKGAQEKFAIIDPNGQGFSMVESNNGTFLISCKGAEQYLDGHKLILNIGNPYFMTYSGFTMKAKFGTRPPEFPKDAPAEQTAEWQKKYGEWEKTLKEKELFFTDELAAGAWSKVELVLAPSKPEEVAYVSVSMRTNQVSLRKPKE